MLLRYVQAVFFFTNSYWLFGLIICKKYVSIAVVMLLLFVAVLAVCEHVKLYGAQNEECTKKLHFSITYYLMQLVVNVFLMLVIVTDIGFSTVFPFVVDSSRGRISLLLLILIGIFLTITCLFHINNILQRRDRMYRHIQKFKKNTSEI